MFERFTPAARQVVVRGQDEARAFGHSWLGTEHLLLGVLAGPQAPAVGVLTDLGVTVDTGRAALRRLVGLGRGGLGESDAEALRALGIDLDEVRRRVEASFGPGALDHPPHRERGAAGRGAAGAASSRRWPGISRSCRGRSVPSNARSARPSPSATGTSVWSIYSLACSTRAATWPSAAPPRRKPGGDTYSCTRRHR